MINICLYYIFTVYSELKPSTGIINLDLVNFVGLKPVKKYNYFSVYNPYMSHSGLKNSRDHSNETFR